jgi:hypothetical protein
MPRNLTDASIFQHGTQLFHLLWSKIDPPPSARSTRDGVVFHFWVGQTADTACNYSCICSKCGMTEESFSNESHIESMLPKDPAYSCPSESPIRDPGIFQLVHRVTVCCQILTLKCYLLVH